MAEGKPETIIPDEIYNPDDSQGSLNCASPDRQAAHRAMAQEGIRKDLEAPASESVAPLQQTQADNLVQTARKMAPILAAKRREKVDALLTEKGTIHTQAQKLSEELLRVGDKLKDPVTKTRERRVKLQERNISERIAASHGRIDEINNETDEILENNFNHMSEAVPTPAQTTAETADAAAQRQSEQNDELTNNEATERALDPIFNGKAGADRRSEATQRVREANKREEESRDSGESVRPEEAPSEVVTGHEWETQEATTARIARVRGEAEIAGEANSLRPALQQPPKKADPDDPYEKAHRELDKAEGRLARLERLGRVGRYIFRFKDEYERLKNGMKKLQDEANLQTRLKKQVRRDYTA